jgi:hypothetical protein
MAEMVWGSLIWKRINPGHYMADDEQFEIIRTSLGWEWTARATGRGAIERTLRDAKHACWSGTSVSGRTTYDGDEV